MIEAKPEKSRKHGGAPRPGLSLLDGVALCVGLAAFAALLGARLPVVGGPVFGIVLGMLVKSTGRIGYRHGPGIAFCAKQLLQYSIVLLGAGLSLGDIMTTGGRSLSVMFGTLAICLTAAWLAGRMFNVSPSLTTLIGVGTAICGASAIAAVSPVIDAEERDVAYAVSTIFLFNVVAVLVFPPAGRWLGLTQAAFGLWAGTAINDTSSVVAAAYAYGGDAGSVATVVKLTRSTLIIPVTLTLAGMKVLHGRLDRGSPVNVGRLMPWFILGFLFTSLLNTFGFLPTGAIQLAVAAAKFLIVVALTAVGLSADFAQMARTGLKPVGLGLLLWLTITVSSLIIQIWTGSDVLVR